ncbi:MAG: hypothetical protein Q4G03_08665 [Planctomycetia bacterium]|nr:hypothetical protein [Planctomycetia bacterium]
MVFFCICVTPNVCYHGSCALSEETVDADYIHDFAAFSSRFIRPDFPQNAPAEEQKNWYALKKTCGRDLIKLSLSQWPSFSQKPSSVADDAWDKFVALAELGRFTIGEAIFDENHGGTLIKKYYSTDYEAEHILALDRIAREQIALVSAALNELTDDETWKIERRCELEAFWEDFSQWFAPYCRASLTKLPSTSEFVKQPDNFLIAANLLEFAVNYIPDEELFTKTLEGIQELLQSPKAVEIRVFHGRFEGYDLLSRDVIFARYCARIAAVAQKSRQGLLSVQLVEAKEFNHRQTERFEHDALASWGCANSQQHDYFYVVFPKDGIASDRPLYVVLHSAGHTGEHALDCTLTPGNHDIYTVPDDFYGLFVDCAENRDTDWWWGGRRGDEAEITEALASRSTTSLQPVEKRVLAEIAWTITRYGIDPNRVYLCGNSMGGSGALGLGLSHGEVFAAIKANVPAGVWHAYDRLQLSESNAPEGLSEPPVCFDYSAQNDKWSAFHEVLIKGVEARKYAYILYWGNYGHENNDAKVAEYNDLFKTFDWTSIRKDAAYPAFTNSSTDSPLPWPDDLENESPGQRGAYYRWTNKSDTVDSFSMELRLASAEELASKIFEIPTESQCDVTLRRLQKFAVSAGDTLTWRFGDQSGTFTVGEDGLVTIPGLTITTEAQTLTLTK